VVDGVWRELARSQEGLISRRQLRGLGVTRSEIRNHLDLERWAVRSAEVLSTTTGPLAPLQRLWLGALHGGPTAMIAGLNAATHRGLKGWDRDEITVLVSNPMSFEPLDGFCFFRSRRPSGLLLGTGVLPVCKLEPAVLLFASRERNIRTALGSLAAVVQQKLTTPDKLREGVALLKPLRRADAIRTFLDDLDGGAQSLTEVETHRLFREWRIARPDTQKARHDRAGKRRYTDCEWKLRDGRTLVLEINGGFHDDVLQSMDDSRRSRKLTTPERIVVTCTGFELRHEPWAVMEDLIALGVPRSDAS
jgi:hypothetical protein